MKFKINSEDFSNAISWVTQGAALKETHPVTLALDSEDSAHVYFFDGTQYAKDNLDISNFNGDFEKTKILMDAKFVKTLAKVIKDFPGEMQIEEQKSQLLVKTQGGNKFHIPLLDQVSPSEPEIITIGEVDEAEFFEIISRVSKISDPSSTLTLVNSVGFVFDMEKTGSEQVIAIATDKFAFSEVRVPFVPAKTAGGKKKQQLTYALPASKATIANSTKTVGSPVALITSTNMGFGYSFGDGRIVLFSTNSDEVMMKPSEQMKAAAEKTNQSATFSKKDFEKALNAISNLSLDSNTKNLKVVIKNSKMSMSDIDDNNSINIDLIDSEIEEDIEITVLRDAVRKAMLPVTTANMKIKWVEQSKVMQVVCVDNDGNDIEEIFTVCIVAL